MKPRLNSRLAVAVVAFAAALGSWAGPSSIARAASQDELDTKTDARLECYPTDANAALKDSGTPAVWLVLVLISIVGMGGMFMNAKRANLE